MAINGQELIIGNGINGNRVYRPLELYPTLFKLPLGIGGIGTGRIFMAVFFLAGKIAALMVNKANKRCKYFIFMGLS